MRRYHPIPMLGKRITSIWCLFDVYLTMWFIASWFRAQISVRKLEPAGGRKTVTQALDKACRMVGSCIFLPNLYKWFQVILNSTKFHQVPQNPASLATWERFHILLMLISLAKVKSENPTQTICFCRSLNRTCLLASWYTGWSFSWITIPVDPNTLWAGKNVLEPALHARRGNGPSLLEASLCSCSKMRV